jgi:hypothetical protein
MSVWLHLPYVWLWTIFICLMYGCGLFLFALCNVLLCTSILRLNYVMCWTMLFSNDIHA